MKLKSQPFDKIQSGAKTIELRLFDEKRRRIQVSDIIVFKDIKNSERQIQAIVIAPHKFASFAKLYKSLPLIQCGYSEETIGKAVPADMDSYYSKEQQDKYGVVGIEIKLKEINR